MEKVVFPLISTYPLKVSKKVVEGTPPNNFYSLTLKKKQILIFFFSFRKYVCCDCGAEFLSLQKCLKHDRQAHTGFFPNVLCFVIY